MSSLQPLHPSTQDADVTSSVPQLLASQSQITLPSLGVSHPSFARAGVPVAGVLAGMLPSPVTLQAPHLHSLFLGPLPPVEIFGFSA